MKTFLTATVAGVTLISWVFAFGGKNLGDRSNGARVTSAGLLALAILAALAW